MPRYGRRATLYQGVYGTAGIGMQATNIGLNTSWAADMLQRQAKVVDWTSFSVLEHEKLALTLDEAMWMHSVHMLDDSSKTVDF